VDGTTLFQHFFMRLAFLPSWKNIVPAEKQEQVFGRIEARLNEQARLTGKCILTVPFVVINCEKNDNNPNA
jgi:arsenite methyltransferase